MTSTAYQPVRPSDENVDRAGPGPVFRCELTAEEASLAVEVARQCAEEYRRVDAPAFLRDARVIAHELPERARRLLNSGRLEERKHVLVVSGNLVDERSLGLTPASWREADRADCMPYAFLAMLYGALLGDSIGWADQQAGRLVTDVVPTSGYEYSLVSASSSKELGWHTEDAFSPARADYVGLLCLRSPDLTPTTVGYVDVARLPEETVEVLRQRRFRTYPDSAHEHSGGRPVLPVAVLEGCPDAPVLRIDRDFTVAADGDEEAQRALRTVVAHIDDNLYDLTLQAGDMGFIDNRTAVHGRRAFQATFRGSDRWLKRVNIVEDLRRTRPDWVDGSARIIG
ncbi:arginine beta-hydroxylase [Kitasatospora sp. MMS16-BH015]|uniref:TauD/TfdA family dioxygenase n=1 Tax=Kitasatospora sp. MMS16-BH015 TaxID=2018025 RepID=UPI000CA113DA|nr:TauD/TfdA family dioxygenase [Kitasatospora sp. MMS16-BH015]AUG76130.1 arginine beta-hydroxylase [Kitasatospora sp. MMS16-BH015]